MAITDQNLGQPIADNLKLPYIDLETEPIDRHVLSAIPKAIAKKHQLICCNIKDGHIIIATTNPEQPTFIQNLKKKLGQKVKIFYTTKRSIEHGLDWYKDDIESDLNQLIDSIPKSAYSNAPIATIANLMIDYADSCNASHIHLEPTDQVSNIRFRVDGDLRDILTIPKNLHDQIISHIDRHLNPQGGKIGTSIEEDGLDIHISIVPVVSGQKAILKLHSSRSKQLELSDLGMKVEDQQKVLDAIAKPKGMILFAGPTDSGKTSTIYAILKTLNAKKHSIATIEDPIEYQISGINQIQVNTKTNLTFANGLRATLRQNPNIIYVGEIRDNETSDIAINTALTRHLVLSTLQTNDASSTISRLLDLGCKSSQIASTVNTIVAQRLVRKICERCKVSRPAEHKHLKDHIPEKIFKQYFGKKKIPSLYIGKGCDLCGGTGYKGRIGLFEVLVISKKIQQLINNKSDSDTIRHQAIKEGMTTILENGLQKALAGTTTVDEIIRTVTV